MVDQDANLDKLRFSKVLELNGIVVPQDKVQAILRDESIREFLSIDEKVKHVYPCHLITEWLDSQDDLDLESHRVILVNNIESVKKLDAFNSLPAVRVKIVLTYDSFTADEILKKILPEGIQIPSSFETVGHIAHLNLSTQQLPFKKIIGQVLLDKNRAIKTVVNKITNVESEFRVCPLEILAGEDNLVTTIKENDLRFRIDFGKVFWNSRLSGERHYISREIPTESIICDVMGGVGAFGMYLRKKNCRIFANDLNSEAVELMKINMKLNKCPTEYYSTFNMDGRAFIRLMLRGDDSMKSLLISNREGSSNEVSESKKRKIEGTEIYFLMNLPAIAIEFLDAFVDVFNSEEDLRHTIGESHALESLRVINIICYCFEKKDDTELIKKRISKALGDRDLDFKLLKVRPVRNVSPTVEMYACHIQPELSLLGIKGSGGDGVEKTSL